MGATRESNWSLESLASWALGLAWLAGFACDFCCSALNARLQGKIMTAQTSAVTFRTVWRNILNRPCAGFMRTLLFGHDPSLFLFIPLLKRKTELLNAKRPSINQISQGTALHSSGPLLSEKFFSRIGARTTDRTYSAGDEVQLQHHYELVVAQINFVSALSLFLLPVSSRKRIGQS